MSFRVQHMFTPVIKAQDFLRAVGLPQDVKGRMHRGLGSIGMTSPEPMPEWVKKEGVNQMIYPGGLVAGLGTRSSPVFEITDSADKVSLVGETEGLNPDEYDIVLHPVNEVVDDGTTEEVYAVQHKGRDGKKKFMRRKFRRSNNNTNFQKSSTGLRSYDVPKNLANISLPMPI